MSAGGSQYKLGFGEGLYGFGGYGFGGVPPTAAFFRSPQSVLEGEQITFDASGTSDPDGSVVAYDWTFGDGSTGSGQVVTHTYANPNTYTVQLTVTDNHGFTSTATQSVTVGEMASETPSASISASPTNPNVGATVTFDGGGSTDPDGSIVAYDWNMGDGSQRSGSIVEHSYATPGSYTVTLTVTDNDGLTSTTTTSIMVVDEPGGEPTQSGISLPVVLGLLGAGYAGYKSLR